MFMIGEVLVRDFEFSALLTWGGVGLVVASAAAIARWVQRSVQRRPEVRDSVLRRYASLKFFHLLFFIGFYICAFTFSTGLGRAKPEQARGAPSPEPRALMLPGTEVLLLAPFVLGLVLSWACFLRRRPCVTAAQSVGRSPQPSGAGAPTCSSICGTTSGWLRRR